jgi:thioredoxin reductase (NADPH)
MKDYELVVVGGGPGGISMAVEAIQAGIDRDRVLVIEKHHEHSWAIRKFYPEQKLVAANYKGMDAVCLGNLCLIDSTKSETLSYIDRAIGDFGLSVHYNESVYKIQINEDGSFSVFTNEGEYRSKICVVAIGIMGKPNRPDWKITPDIKAHVHFDITSEPIEDKNVLVIGGGDSASEYCQYLLQADNNVTLSYRRENFNRMNEINRQTVIDLEKQKKLSILYTTNVEQVEEYDGGVKVSFQERESLVFDKVVLALGGSTPKNFLSVLGIEFNGNEPALKDGYETTIPGLFLVGDLSAGRKGGSIISAFNSSHEAMKKICDNYLECKI